MHKELLPNGPTPNRPVGTTKKHSISAMFAELQVIDSHAVAFGKVRDTSSHRGRLPAVIGTAGDTTRQRGSLHPVSAGRCVRVNPHPNPDFEMRAPIANSSSSLLGAPALAVLLTRRRYRPTPLRHRKLPTFSIGWVVSETGHAHTHTTRADRCTCRCKAWTRARVGMRTRCDAVV